MFIIFSINQLDIFHIPLKVIPKFRNVELLVLQLSLLVLLQTSFQQGHVGSYCLCLTSVTSLHYYILLYHCYITINATSNITSSLQFQILLHQCQSAVVNAYTAVQYRRIFTYTQQQWQFASLAPCRLQKLTFQMKHIQYKVTAPMCGELNMPEFQHLWIPLVTGAAMHCS